MQFYEPSTQLGVAVGTAANGSSTDLLLQLTAPSSASWAAVGIGSQMRGALMFVLLPLSAGGAGQLTVSVRSAPGHQMPTPLSGVDYEVRSAKVQGANMTASIVCHGCTSWSGGTLDTASTKAPWIWAVGPSAGSSGGGSSRHRVKRDSASINQGGNIQEHEEKGQYLC